jgi:hypothetical protein
LEAIEAATKNVLLGSSDAQLSCFLSFIGCYQPLSPARYSLPVLRKLG